jgi:ankyrin repeat protein
MTALMMASQNGHLGIAQLLVERGANVNATKTDNGKTALMRACEKGHLETVRFLLSRGAGKTARNTAGKTAYALSAAYPAIRTQVKP